eukprot:15470229-Alexandrium_andersonii.AAC.1
MDLVIVAIIKAWEKGWRQLHQELRSHPPTNASSVQFYREWENLTIDQVQREILEATEQVRLKRPRSPRDELVAKM